MKKINSKSAASRELTFEEFYEKYYLKLVDYCSFLSSLPNSSAEDISEDVFVELWKHWNNLESHAEFVLLSWTKKAAFLLSKAQRRKSANEPVCVEYNEQIVEEHLRGAKEAVSSMEEQITENAAYLHYLSRIEKRLSLKENLLFDCLVVKGMTVKETAILLSVSEATVKVSFTRLRAKLRNKILPDILPSYPKITQE